MKRYNAVLSNIVFSVKKKINNLEILLNNTLDEE